MEDKKFNEKLKGLRNKRFDVDMDKIIKAFRKENWTYFKKVYGVLPESCSQAEAILQKRLKVKW